MFKFNGELPEIKSPKTFSGCIPVCTYISSQLVSCLLTFLDLVIRPITTSYVRITSSFGAMKMTSNNPGMFPCGARLYRLHMRDVLFVFTAHAVERVRIIRRCWMVVWERCGVQIPDRRDHWYENCFGWTLWAKLCFETMSYQICTCL